MSAAGARARRITTASPTGSTSATPCTESAEELARGMQKLRDADEAAGGQLQLVADLRLYATTGRVG